MLEAYPIFMLIGWVVNTDYECRKWFGKDIRLSSLLEVVGTHQQSTRLTMPMPMAMLTDEPG